MLNLVKVHFTHHILCAKIHIFIQITKLLGIFLVRITVEPTSNLRRIYALATSNLRPCYIEPTPLLHFYQKSPHLYGVSR